MAGLYLHIPFCKRVCAYCDFYKSADLRPMKAVVEAMHDELRREAGFLPAEQLRTIYFGGGTPSLLPPEELEEFIAHAAELFDCTALEECTVEANPDDLTPDYLRRLARTRVDRLSIGVQSFDDGELRLMNRRHTADAARKAVRQAQEAGFGNVTVDLIFGVPGFGAATLARNLRETVALGVQRVSAYHLTVEPQTAFGRRMAQGRFSPVTEETSEEEFLTVHRTLRDAGFEHYEVSNYALPGRRAIHNSSYWSGDPSGNRPCGTFVRRRMPTLGRRRHRALPGRRRPLRIGAPDRTRPLQRDRDDGASHGRRARYEGDRATVRAGAARSPARRGAPVARRGRRHPARRTAGDPRRTVFAVGRRDRRSVLEC